MSNTLRILEIRKSLKHVALTLKSEWRMFVNIGWLPFTLFCISQYLIAYSPVKISWVIYMPFIAMTLKAAVSAVTMVGVYRYLLSDSRFHISTFPFRRNLEALKPLFTARWYFCFDKSVIILTVFFIIWEIFYRYTHNLIMPVIDIHSIKDVLLSPSFDKMVLVYLWEIILFFISSQLCLVYAYISTSQNISLENIFYNIKTLERNRIRVWIVQVVIAVLFAVAGILAYLLFDLLSDKISAVFSYGYYIVRMIIWFIALLASAVFGAVIFKSIGVREQ